MNSVLHLADSSSSTSDISSSSGNAFFHISSSMSTWNPGTVFKMKYNDQGSGSR
ncbi:hypothetical protein DERF_013145 [Dermatophagoides farinae]|uniref:Uncharacterized protein n=1 Tax=Dermatophagoides farinae TaxID=6954 RepID=A0A922HQX3_DERFA|nr:hypothetical protein DERF_013145 [Dermatophagoides farinae]